MFIQRLWSVKWSLPTMEWAAFSFQNDVSSCTFPCDPQQANGLAGRWSALEPEHGFNDRVETKCLIHENWLWQNMNNWTHSCSNTGTELGKTVVFLQSGEIAAAPQLSLFPSGHSHIQTYPTEGNRHPRAVTFRSLSVYNYFCQTD